MALLSLLGPRTRSKQSISSLSVQTEFSTVSPNSTTPNSPSTSPHTRKRLRKQPPLPHQNSGRKEDVVSDYNSQTPLPLASLSRGTLGGFCPIDDLERHGTSNSEQKDSVMRSIGRKIGLGLRLQSDSPTDLSHVVDAPESWYISYPPLTPTFPSANNSPTSDIEPMDDAIMTAPATRCDISAFSEEDNDTLSFKSYTSYSSSSSASTISILVDNDAAPEQDIAVESLIISTQDLADQYRTLLSRSPTPGPHLRHLPLPSPLHSHPFHASDTDNLTPLPLNIAQRSRSRQKHHRPSRRLSQKQPPIIPTRQHFKVPPATERTLRKVKARHSLHKFIDDAAVSELYEPFFKRSRLSECSTLVSSQENTPHSSPRTQIKELEAFPQIFVVDEIDFPQPPHCVVEVEKQRRFVNTPGVPRRSERRPRPFPIPTPLANVSRLQVPTFVYKYLVPVADKSNGGVQWEVWI